MKDSIGARLNHLKTLLKENYHRGFPILKELIQNADDAEASEMKIILTSGISDAEHPLLRHPILIVINNGMFSADDREAINQIGASAKVTQKSTVGRFGLGIKSLFHLCDCFFCLAPEHNSQLFSINPYSTANDQGKEFDEHHKEWNVGFENDTKLVIELLMDYQANLETGLITIIPLRQKGDEPCLSKDYTPGDSAISLFDIFKVTSDQPDIITLAESLAPLFPMLRYLRQISFFSLDTKPPSQPSLELTCSAVTASGHMPFDEERMTKEQLLQFAGEVTLKFGRNKLGAGVASDTKYRYFGTAKWNTDQLFQAIKEQPEWPRQNGVDKNGDVLDEKEKASPHGSIIIGVFDRLVNQKPFVKITPAVFLPIGIAENIKPSISLYANVTTHGYWFVDSGRQHILGLKNTEAGEPQTIHENWNRLVAKHITFPLLIPTLAEVASQPGTKHQEIVEITQAIAESVWLKPNLGVICSEWQWICQLTHDGSKSYQKIKASNPVYLIAAPPESDPSRPFDVMPGLKDKDITCLIVTGDVHLLNSQNTRRLWPDHLLGQVLESIEVEKTFTNQNHLTYLRDFLQTIKSESKSKHIFRLLQHAFGSVRYRDIRANKKVVSEIVGFVDLSQRVRLSVSQPVTDAYEDLIKSLAEETAWLCTPAELWPADDDGDRKLSFN